MATLNVTLTKKSNQKWGSRPKSCVSAYPWPAMTPTTPTTMIGTSCRRVASETAASVAGPADPPEKSVISPVRTATVRGQRRRSITSGYDASPPAASSQNSTRWSSHCAVQACDQISSEMPRQTASRQVWEYHFSGGWNRSGLGRVDTPRW